MANNHLRMKNNIMRNKVLSRDLKNSGGTFIGARLTSDSADLVYAYARYIGIPKDQIIPKDELHVSIIYCKGKFPIVPYPVMDAEEAKFRIYNLVYIGNAIALIGESQWLRSRVKLARSLGLTSSFPGYIPHISLTYKPDVDITKIQKPDFMLHLGQEYVEPLMKKF